MYLASLPRISANLNENYSLYNFQALANISGNFQKISGNIKFPENLQPQSCLLRVMYQVWVSLSPQMTLSARHRQSMKATQSSSAVHILTVDLLLSGSSASTDQRFIFRKVIPADMFTINTISTNAGNRLRNSLSTDVTSATTLSVLCSRLKTYFFPFLSFLFFLFFLFCRWFYVHQNTQNTATDEH